jgi:PAS domain S-box-containing protein
MADRHEKSAASPAWEATLGPHADALLEAASGAGIGVAVTLVDGDAPINVYVSDGFAHMFGQTREVLLERSPFSFIAPADKDRMRERFAKRHLGDRQTVRYELSIVHGDGHLVPLEISVGDVTIDGRHATVTFATDITERRRAADAARRTEASFKELIEAVPEAIGIMRDNRFLYANAAYVRLLGHETSESLLATPLDQLVHPEDVAMQKSREARILGSGQPLPSQLYRGIRRDGSRVELEVTSVPFVYEGKPAILGIGRDVTERRRMETQLLQADRLAALGTLAAGVAHEVNNPLAYLSLNLEWLARQLPELARDPERLPSLALMLEEARHGADRVAAIVRDLRAFSRADGETRGPVDLGAAVASSIKMAAHDIRHRATVTTDVDDDVPPAWANDARLEQVLLNLLLNAVQAMDETTTEKNEIRVTVRAGAPGRAVIEVSDNGPGIPPETARRIFDPFFTTKAVGTGLGLSICHSIVTSFGGRISVQSRVGEGSTFRIELPTRPHVADSTRPPPPEQDADGALPARRARVLVVDDEVTIANTLRELLQVDHDVVAVTSAIDALDRMRAGARFDVVLCDLMMPQMSGIDLYERLRDLAPGLEGRLVFMTGGAFTSRAADFLARVPNRRIEKPFALTTIEELVRVMARSGGAGTEAR